MNNDLIYKNLSGAIKLALACEDYEAASVLKQELNDYVDSKTLVADPRKN